MTGREAVAGGTACGLRDPPTEIGRFRLSRGGEISPGDRLAAPPPPPPVIPTPRGVGTYFANASCRMLAATETSITINVKKRLKRVVTIAYLLWCPFLFQCIQYPLCYHLRNARSFLPWPRGSITPRSLRSTTTATTNRIRHRSFSSTKTTETSPWTTGHKIVRRR